MYQQQIAQCDEEIEAYLTSLNSQIELEETESGTKSPQKKKCCGNEPAFD